jgi:hypothetical protein
MSSNPSFGEVYSIQHYVIKFVSDLCQIDGFLWAASEIIQGNWSQMNFLSIRLSIIIFPISFIDDNFVTLLQLKGRVHRI